MSFFRQSFKTKLSNRLTESGNVFMMLFGAVAMVGVIGASTMTVLKGPVKTMSEVTKRTIAENNMIAAGKLALIAAASQADIDCDDDLYLEPIPYGAAVSGFTGGGELPASIGVAKQDPWGGKYVYCAWDHGPEIDSDFCTGQNRKAGTNADTEYSIAIISPGPDGVYNTTCHDYSGANTTLIKAPGSDDLVLGYTYAEAGTMTGGLWGLEAADSDTAEIVKDLSVKDAPGGTETFALDAGTGNLTIGGAGSFPSISTDFLSSLNNVNIVVNDPLVSSADITTSTNMGAANITASGNVTINGNTTLGNAITDTTGIAGNATVGGTLGVTGTSTLAAVNAGATTVSTLSTSGNVTLGDAITDTTDITGVLDVAGASTLDSLAVTNNATVGTTLGVTGTSNLQTVNIGGKTTMVNDVTVNPDIQFASQGLIAATSSFYVSIDSDNNTTNTGFVIIKDKDVTTGATELFRVREDGSADIHGLLNMTTNKIGNVVDPTLDQDAATKKYVDDRVTSGGGGGVNADYLDGLDSLQFLRSDVADTADGLIDFTAGINADGRIAITSNGVNHRTYYTDDTHYGYFSGYNNSGARGFFLGYGNGGSTVSLYLDNANELDITGGKLDMNGNKIQNVLDPTVAQDAATKNYVDTVVTSGAGGGVNADLLDNLDSLQFLRSDVADTAAGEVTFGSHIKMGANQIKLGTANLQTLYGNNGAALVYDSNNSTTTQLQMRDLENLTYGSLYGSGNGVNFGLLDGDGNWSYLAVKDSDTRFYINNAIEMRLFPTYLDMYTKRITNVTNPTGAQDAATKNYVDTVTTGGSGGGTDADLLDGLDSTAFIRSNANDDVTGHTEWQDGYTARFGTSADFRIWHNGTDSYLRSYLNGARILLQGNNLAGTNRAILYGDPDSATTVYYAGSSRIATTATGVKLTGIAGNAPTK